MPLEPNDAIVLHRNNYLYEYASTVTHITGKSDDAIRKNAW